MNGYLLEHRCCLVLRPVEAALVPKSVGQDPTSATQQMPSYYCHHRRSVSSGAARHPGRGTYERPEPLLRPRTGGNEVYQTSCASPAIFVVLVFGPSSPECESKRTLT